MVDIGNNSAPQDSVMMFFTIRSSELNVIIVIIPQIHIDANIKGKPFFCLLEMSSSKTCKLL